MKSLHGFRTVTSSTDIETGQEKKSPTPWTDFLGFDREAQAISVTTTWYFLDVDVQSCITVYL